MSKKDRETHEETITLIADEECESCSCGTEKKAQAVVKRVVGSFTNKKKFI